MFVLFIRLLKGENILVYPEEIYEVPATGRYCNYFKEKGYVSINKKFYVKQKDLLPHSGVQEKRTCDICGKNYFKRHEQHEVTFKRWGKDICQNCYWNDSNYRKEIQKRTQATYEKNFGGHPMRNPEVKEKVNKTLKERYGGSPMKNEEVREKFFKTMQERYGGNSPFCDEKIREKARKTLYTEGLVPTSNTQREVYNILKKLYPDSECELNYPLSKLSLDVYFYYKNTKIDIEYDGKYWHNDEQKDRRRDEFTKKQGFKIFRIKSRREVPKPEEIKEKIEFLLDTDHFYTELTLKDW